jgi:hypothetical protein
VHGFTVITSSGEKVGHLVGEDEDFLIVESGHIFKSKHAVPRTFAHTDESLGTVCVTITKDVIEESPPLSNGEVEDRQAVARYYGLASGFEAPDTEGYGETLPDDPGLGDQGTVETERERAEVRKDLPEDSPDEEIARHRTRPGV